MPGLSYLDGCVTADEEQRLVVERDALPWRAGRAGRRDQMFGGIFDDGVAPRIDTTTFVPIPRFVTPLCTRLAADRLELSPP